MFNFFNRFKKRSKHLGQRITEELTLNPKDAGYKEPEINDNVIFSGVVDSYSDAEDAKLAERTMPGAFKKRDNLKLSNYY